MTKDWLTLQLSEKGEQLFEEDPFLLETIVKKYFLGKYFLPLFYDKNKNYHRKIFLMRGYIFLEHSESISYNKILSTPYFTSFISRSGNYCKISDDEIMRLKDKLKSLLKPVIKKGDIVLVLDGEYKNLYAEVTEFYADVEKADLKINLRSLEIIVPGISIVHLSQKS